MYLSIVAAGVGARVVGAFVGAEVIGAFVGAGVVGAFVGAEVIGAFVGAEVVGAFVGAGVVGAFVGAEVNVGSVQILSSYVKPAPSDVHVAGLKNPMSFQIGRTVWSSPTQA